MNLLLLFISFSLIFTLLTSITSVKVVGSIFKNSMRKVIEGGYGKYVPTPTSTEKIKKYPNIYYSDIRITEFEVIPSKFYFPSNVSISLRACKSTDEAFVYINYINFEVFYGKISILKSSQVVDYYLYQTNDYEYEYQELVNFFVNGKYEVKISLYGEYNKILSQSKFTFEFLSGSI